LNDMLKNTQIARFADEWRVDTMSVRHENVYLCLESNKYVGLTC